MAKEHAIIFDLDGTLAHLNGRKPYGEAQADCVHDLLNADLYEILVGAYDAGINILLVTGRFDTYEAETAQWLHAHAIPYDGLFMRSAKDTREDQVIKEEIYRNEIEPYFSVIRVYDDRPKVIRMWQANGLEVVDCGNGVEF